jgi:ankyrin repeat protein
MSTLDHINLVQLLLEYGANVHMEDEDNQTPLHHLFEVQGSSLSGPGVEQITGTVTPGPGVIQLLVERGADLDKRDRYHRTPLHMASPSQHLMSVQVLLDLGANVNAEDDKGQTPLHRVFECRDLKDGFGVVQLLVERGADVNARNKIHETPLHSGLELYHLHLVSALLSIRRDIDIGGLRFNSPIQYFWPQFNLSHESQDRTSWCQFIQSHESSKSINDILRLLVDRGTNVNTRDTNHNTPLHLASYCQDLKLIRLLLNHGANVNVQNTDGQTPLHVVFLLSAYSEDSFGIVQLLLERGADVNTREDHESPLHLASWNGRLDSVRALLNCGANVNAKDSQGRTPLYQALRGSSIEDAGFGVVQLLVEHGAAVNTRDKDDETPLHRASYYQHLKSVRMLLDHGANVDAENTKGQTPLQQAFELSSKDQVDIIQLLVERGADVNTRDMDHQTPLHFASSSQRLEIVRALLDHGANVNAENTKSQTPLRHLLEETDGSEDGFSVVQLLVECGTDVDTEDYNPETQLHVASYHHQLGWVRAFLNHGADVNAKDPWGQTPLHQVFRDPSKYNPGDYVILQLLLKHGADVNVQDEFYETPLHLASRLGLFEGPWILLEHSADLTVKNEEEMTPFQLVQEVIREETRGGPPEYYHWSTIVERVVLMCLLYEY